MTRRVPFNTTVDNGGRYHGAGPTCVGRIRTIKIRLERMPRGYEVRVWGDAFPETESISNRAVLRAHKWEIRDWIAALHTTWSDFAEWQDPSDRSPDAHDRHPFADQVDLRRAVTEQQLHEMWRNLAEAGYQLFQLLFMNGDARLRTLGDRLVKVLWAGEHVITVISNDVVAPWSMLYVPKGGRPPSSDSAFEVDPSAFLGYRHLIEHAFEMKYDPNPEVRFNGPICAGAYYDKRLDEPRKPRKHRPKVVAPVVELLERYATVRSGTSRTEVGNHLHDKGAHDHLIYFCCHCVQVEWGRAFLRLTDADKITASDFQSWLGRDGLRSNPLVVVNACRSGNLGSHSPSHFGRIMLKHGAGCLLGPCVNMPAVFASDFAQEFFSRVLASQQWFGDAVRSLTRHYADQYLNPLGLSYSLFHGINGHFCPTEVPGAVTAAEG